MGSKLLGWVIPLVAVASVLPARGQQATPAGSPGPELSVRQTADFAVDGKGSAAPWAKTEWQALATHIESAHGRLDGGRTWVDGQPLLGDHKTIRGTISGLAAGVIVGVIQLQPLRGTLLSVGAIGGDLIVSFVKRRLRLKPGAMFPVADQMGFIVRASNSVVKMLAAW